MQILDGQLVSKATKDELRLKVAQLVTEGKKIPHLAAVLVGSNGASETYVGAKVKSCEEIGYKSTLVRMEENISENKLLAVIEDLNNDPDIDGILVQLPCQNIFPMSILSMPSIQQKMWMDFTRLMWAKWYRALKPSSRLHPMESC